MLQKGRKIIVLMAIAVSIAVYACDGAEQGMFTPSRPAIIEPAAGIWIGDFFSPAFGDQFRVLGVISENRKAQFNTMFPDEVHYAGTVDTTDETIAGTLRAYIGVEGPFVGVSGLDRLSLSGTVIARERIFGRYWTSDDRGEFTLSYQEESYERDSSLRFLRGIWVVNYGSSGGGVYTLTFDIDADGMIFGTDTAGCIYSGEFSIINPSFNAYGVSITVSSCNAADGFYDGLATLTDGLGHIPGSMRLLSVAASGDTLALVTSLDKQ